MASFTSQDNLSQSFSASSAGSQPQPPSQAAPPTSAGGLRRWLRKEDVVQGTILFLLEDEEMEEKYAKRHKKPRQDNIHGISEFGAEPLDPEDAPHVIWGPFNYPVVVISRPADNPETIFFLPITTVDHPIQELRSRWEHKHLVHIDPAPEHPLAKSNFLYSENLSLQGQQVMKKQGVVLLDTIYQAETWRDFRLYTCPDSPGGPDQDRCLDDASVAHLETLLHHLHPTFVIGEQYQMTMLDEMFKRYSRLRNRA